MKPVLGRDLGIEMCKILGLDTHSVYSIDIHISVKDVVTVKITRYVDRKEMNILYRLLEEREYKLVENQKEESIGDINFQESGYDKK